MREIFTHIASFVHRRTRDTGILSFFGTQNRTRKTVAFILAAMVCGALLIFGRDVYAQNNQPPPSHLKDGFLDAINPIGWILRGISALLEVGVWLAGKMATLLVSILIEIAQYNDFLSSSAVANGWVVTRDIANMFFIVVLLVIAFGTILGSEKYNTKLLAQLLIMAVAINFSRTFIGIMIDASQVVMLTFVNGFSAAGAGNFINAFGVTKVMQYAVNAGDLNVTGLTALISALIMGLVLMLVACSVLLTIVGTLLFRIAYLWLLIVIAPLTWLMSTIPAGKAYYDKWWAQFRDQLIVGPAMAFFLWLSLTAVGSGLAWNQVVVKGGSIAKIELGPTVLLSSENILSFIITVVLLLASAKMAQDIAGSAAGYGAFMKKWASGIARGKKFAIGTAKVADRVQGLATGIQFAKIPAGIKAGLDQRTKKMEEAIKKRAAGNAAAMAVLPGGGLVAQYGYNWLANPKMAIEKVGNGSLKGMWSRFRQGALGTWADKKLQVERPTKKKEAAEARLKHIEDEYKTAKDGLDAVSVQRNALSDVKLQRDRLDITQTEAFYKYAKGAGLVGQGVSFTDYLASLKDRDGELTDFGRKMRDHTDQETIGSEDFYQYAKEKGWTNAETHDDYVVELTNDKGQPSKLAKALLRKRDKELRALSRREGEIQQEIATAQQAESQNGAEWGRIVQAYGTENDEEYGSRIRDLLRQEVKDAENRRRAGTTAYVMGEMPYRKDLVRGWLDEEKDADKLYDWSKPANVIIDYFRHAGATGEERHQGKALKMVAEKGDLRTLIEEEGIRRQDYANASDWVKDFIEKILMGKYHWDREYAYSTMAQAGEKESSNGNWDLASHVKVDAAIGLFEILDNAEHLKKLSKKFEGMPAKDLPSKTNHLSLSYKDEMGVVHETDELRLMLARLSQDMQGISYDWERGGGRANIMNVLVEFKEKIDSNSALPDALKTALKKYIQKRPPKSGESLEKYMKKITEEWLQNPGGTP